MCDTGRVDGPDLLELQCPAVDPLKQAGAGAEDQWCDRYVDLVNQPCGQVLVDDRRAAGQPNVLPA